MVEEWRPNPSHTSPPFSTIGSHVEEGERHKVTSWLIAAASGCRDEWLRAKGHRADSNTVE